MRLSTLLGLLAACVVSVQAAGPLDALAQHMPKCSLDCFEQEIPKSTCAKDLSAKCFCTNTALNAAVGVCAAKTCTKYELLQTKNVSLKGCGVVQERDKGHKFIIAAVTGCAVAVLAFILRMMASIGKTGRPFAWDDATMGVVVLLAIPPTVFAFYLVDNGLGRDIWTLKAEQITNVLFYYYLGEIFYVVALGISKISILFFYLRVFPSKGFRNLTYGVMGLSVLYTIAFFIATTIQCRPISMAWNQWDGLHAGTCNDIHLQGWIAAAINIVLDALVMVLPLKHLANLNMSLKKKLMVMSMFSVGIFVIVISAIRLYSLVHFANASNITWDYVDAGIWSLIEIDVSIICGCMPAHRLLIAKFWPKFRSTVGSTKGSRLKPSQYGNGTDSHLISGDRIQRISMKPKGKDDSDFVPLVNMDTSSARSKEEQEKNVGWITRTSTVDIHHNSSVPATDFTSHKRPDWPLGNAMAAKSHV